VLNDDGIKIWRKDNSYLTQLRQISKGSVRGATRFPENGPVSYWEAGPFCCFLNPQRTFFMKRSLLSCALGVTLGLLLAAPILAETVVHPPAPMQYVNGQRALAPSGSDGFYGKSPSLSGNSVTLNSDPGGLSFVYVYGAYNHKDSDAVGNNQVFINGGSASEAAAGGFHNLPVMEGNVEATGNAITMSGGKEGSSGTAYP
jgi:hypothetical protein